VTIPITVHSVAAAGSHCRVFLRGQNPYARTNLVGRPHRIPSPHQPPSHRVSSLSSLSSHISAKAFPRRRPPHLPTITITHATHMPTGARRRHRDTGLCGIFPHKGSSLLRPGFAASLPIARQSGTVLHPPNLMRMCAHFSKLQRAVRRGHNHHIVCTSSDVDVFLDNPGYGTYIRMRFKSGPYFDR
jgi:hypothetical protein